MSRYKIIALMALFVFALGIAFIGDALAGEKFKIRTVFHSIKSEQIAVPGEEGHVVGVGEVKGIASVLEGNALAPGKFCHYVNSFDMNTKTGVGSSRVYGDTTDADGDIYYWLSEGKFVEGKYWKGKMTIVGGTGKYQGLQGKGTYTSHSVAPGQSYSDGEWEWEWPHR